MFLLPGAYHFSVRDAAGVVQWDDDLISSVPSSSLDVDTPATFGEAVTLGQVVYESVGLGGLTAGLWYKTSTANDWSSSAATIVGLATADYASGATGFVRLVGRMTKLSGLVVGAVYYASAVPGGMTNVRPASNILQIGIPDSTSSILLAIVVAGQFQNWTPSGGIATVVGELHVGGNTTITGTFNVSGASSLADLTVNNALTVLGGSHLGSTAVTGDVTVSSTLAVTGAARVGFLQVGGPSAAFPAWRNTGAVMEAVLADSSAYASVRASAFIGMSTGNSLVDLTVTGAANFGTITSSGSIQSASVVYPGRVDISGGQTQGNWYLGSHGSYGLYSNAGLYLTGGLWINGVPFVAGGPSSIRFQPVITGGSVTAAAGQFILCNGGSATVTLPAPTAGAVVDVKNVGSGVITVVPSSGGIDAIGSYVLSVPYQSVTVVADGSNWWIR